MAEATKVRLVKCPKCENVLPELADYSVYQCGGCGAVLRAKIKNLRTEALMENSDEERVAGVATKSENTLEKETADLSDASLHNSLEKGVMDLSDASNADVRSNACSLRCDDKNPEKNDIECADIYKNQSEVTNGKWVVENDLDMNVNRDDLGNVVARDPGSLNSQGGYASGSRRSGWMPAWERGDRSEMDGFRRIMRTDIEGVRFSTSNYSDEGPSNYNLDSAYSYGERLRDHVDQDAGNRVQYLEKNRVELLRKLDEPKDELRRFCDVGDRPKEKAPLNGRMCCPGPYGGSDTWFPGGSLVPDRASKQFFAPDKHAAGPSYFNHHPEPFPYTNGHEMSMDSLHASMHKSNHSPGYGDPFGSQMLRRASHQLHGQYQQPRSQYYSGHYSDTNTDPFAPYPSNANLHQPSCSCYHCYDQHHGVSAPVPPTTFHYKKFSDVANNPMLYHHENPGAFGPHAYNSRTSIPPTSNFHGPQSHGRWPSDVNFEMGDFVHYRPRKVVLAGGSRHCRPMAGGAPFLTCFNCFELLQIPKKVQQTAKNKQKMQCGACSTVISYAVVNTKLVLSVNTEATQIPTEVDDSSNEMMQDNTFYSYGHMNQINATFSSDDYDNSGYDFQTIDTDPIASSTGQFLNSSKPQEMQSFHSSSLSTSGDEDSPDILIAQREVINSVQQPIKATVSPLPPDSPLEQHFDYSSNNHVVNRFGKGNRSSRSDQEKVITSKVTTRQNSMKEASLATEMEVSFHDFSNTGVSQDSGDATREDDHSKISKGGESFFANIIKKSFKDFSRSNQTHERGRGNVSVNGHLIPARLVKKAEKLAGPIHPGEYWYDFRAGFWGVMGAPCLGIIPPSIEELNYSMPENCAGGNTGVFVNGRELNQKDLDLLASRGLPTDKDKSYIIEISGRVLDEDTGEELDSLGKLAPTVQRVKHGFGMRVPKVAA